jgi:tetratricopeptide (TPR) repeat protein
LLVALAAFGVTRFVSLEPAVPRDGRLVVEPDAATGGDLVSLEQAVAADPSDLAAVQALGIAYVRSAANGDPALYGLAERAFDRADGIRRDDPTTVVGRGLLALSLHQFGAAHTFATKVVAANPDLDAARLVLVDALVELGRYDEARSELERLTVREPGLPVDARVSYLRELNGDLAGAIVAMRAAVTAGAGRPADVASVSQLLGDLVARRGDLAGARDEYERALRLAPGLPLAALGLARIDAAQGRTHEARDRLGALVERAPLPAVIALLADVAPGSGAEELYGATVALARDAGQVVDLEAALFAADHGDPAGALELAAAAYAARPDNVFAQDALAWARYRSGDGAGARALLDGARRLGTPHAELRWHAAAILAGNGEQDAARTELRAVLDAGPAFVFGVRAEVLDLAVRLGLAVPNSWR